MTGQPEESARLTIAVIGNWNSMFGKLAPGLPASPDTAPAGFIQTGH